MELRPIRSRREHAAALKEIEALWNAHEGTPEADRLTVLVLLVETYEREHFPIPKPDPIDLLQHVMEARGLSRSRRGSGTRRADSVYCSDSCRTLASRAPLPSCSRA